MVWPDLAMITTGFTDFSPLLFLAVVVLRVVGLTLDFRLDVMEMGGEGFASRLYDTLAWHSLKPTWL